MPEPQRETSVTLSEEKLERLRAIIDGYGSLLLAFSGGVDSSLLLKVAVERLGKRVSAFTAASPLHQAWEVDEARELAAALGVNHIVCAGDLPVDPAFVANPPERCYYCKKEIFAAAKQVAADLGLAVVADGSNVDDLADFRPGRRALAELGIRSPLQEAGLSKAEIRALSKRFGLPTWDRQPLACLASRIPYGTEITRQRLQQVERCETLLRSEGFSRFRVRYHGDLARIEVAVEDLPRLLTSPLRERVSARCREAGFSYVTVDLDGFRSGSLNETLASGAAPIDGKPV